MKKRSMIKKRILRTWSTEDEIYLQNTLSAVKEQCPNGSKFIIPWLKDLKKRVQQQVITLKTLKNK